MGAGGTALNANGDISTLCSDNHGNIYAGGFFSHGAGEDCFVAKWDGIKWNPLGSSYIRAPVLSMCVDKAGNVYAGGEFTDSSIISSGHAFVAKWNGMEWAEVGAGMGALNANAQILAVSVDTSNNIYAGGYFTDSSAAQGYKYVAWCHDVREQIPAISGMSTVTVYPNPVDDKITVNISEENVNATYYFTDLCGELRSSGKLTEKRNIISMEMLPNGVYFLKLPSFGQTLEIIKTH